VSYEPRYAGEFSDRSAAPWPFRPRDHRSAPRPGASAGPDRRRDAPETQARFALLGADTIGGSADDFEFFIMAERSKWRRVVTAAGIGRR
jgi:hypothetical protein